MKSQFPKSRNSKHSAGSWQNFRRRASGAAIGTAGFSRCVVERLQENFRQRPKWFSLATLALFMFFLLASKTNAQSLLYNDFYRLQMGNLNSIAGESAGSGFNLNITGGQTAPGLYSGTNYKIRAGFQYISSIIPFSFSISNLKIDFGTLSPTNPVTRTNTLTVNDQSASGYIVTASENHQLSVPSNGGIIPDTTCDSGTCTETTATAWNSTLTYGFGYRCDSISVIYNGSTSTGCVAGDNTFYSNPTYYKQFADTSKTSPEIPQSVMSGTSGRNQQATITYKVNIPSSQVAGDYSNNITYIAIPTY